MSYESLQATYANTLPTQPSVSIRKCNWESLLFSIIPFDLVDKSKQMNGYNRHCVIGMAVAPSNILAWHSVCTGKRIWESYFFYVTRADTHFLNLYPFFRFDVWELRDQWLLQTLCHRAACRTFEFVTLASGPHSRCQSWVVQEWTGCFRTWLKILIISRCDVNKQMNFNNSYTIVSVR